MKTNSIIALGAGALLLIGATAGASTYILEKSPEETPVKAYTATASTAGTVTASQAQPPPLPDCDDDNIVGKVVGGAAGGIAGSQIGSGTGKTAATIGGAFGGSLLGEEYLPTKNVTCK